MTDNPPTPPLVFLDTETDGVHPGRKPWEVGMIRREPDGTRKELESFVEIDLSTADPFGLKVGRFYERHPFGRIMSGRMPDPRLASLQSERWTAATVAQWTHGAIVVGAVPNFDTETLDRLLRSCGLIPAWHYHLVDVETLAAGRLRLPPPWDFDKILTMFELGYDESERHTALGDARMAERLYDRVMSGGAAK